MRLHEYYFVKLRQNRAIQSLSRFSLLTPAQAFDIHAKNQAHIKSHTLDGYKLTGGLEAFKTC